MFGYRVKDIIETLNILPDTGELILNKPLLGSIFMIDMGEKKGSHSQGGIRPCIIWENNESYGEIQLCTVIPLTSQMKSLHLPCHVIIHANPRNGLEVDSVALIEQCTAVNNYQIKRPLGTISFDDVLLIQKAMCIQFPMFDLLDDEDRQQYIQCWEKYLKIVDKALMKG